MPTRPKKFGMKSRPVSVDSLITDEVVDFIMRAKAKMPAGWKIVTYEEDFYLILHIPHKEFFKLDIHDQIRIAEVTNELCENIKTTGLPCYIQRV